MGFFDVLRSITDWVFVRNISLVFPGLIALAVCSLLDQLNSYTLPLKTWATFVYILLGLSVASIGNTVGRGLRDTAMFEQFRKSITNMAKEEKPEFKSMLRMVAGVDPIYEQYMRKRVLTGTQFVFSVAVMLALTMSAVLVTWIMWWIKDTPGFESAIDAGFARASPLTYVQTNKLVMLQFNMLALVVGGTVGAAHLAARNHFPKVAGLS